MENNEIRQKIIDCLEVIGIYVDITSDEDINICEYGMSSFEYVVFICEVENAFSIDIPDDYLNIQEVVSINALTEVVLKLLSK